MREESMRKPAGNVIDLLNMLEALKIEAASTKIPNAIGHDHCWEYVQRWEMHAWNL